MKKPSGDAIGFTCLVLFVVLLISGMVYWIYDDYYTYADEAARELKKLDPDYYKMRTGYYETSRQTGLVVWDRTDGTTCETRYVHKKLIYPPPRDCYFTSSPSGGYYHHGRWIDG